MSWHDPITADLIIGFLVGCVFMMLMLMQDVRSRGVSPISAPRYSRAYYSGSRQRIKGDLP